MLQKPSLKGGKTVIRIKTALLSVSDKSGLQELVAFLYNQGVTLIATGGTARFISEMGIPVKEVSEITGFPEILGGRVKTLHPAVEGGILARRELPQDVEDLQKHNIQPIDLVVCNLYPFEKMIASQEKDLEKVVEEIDIGGVTLLRAAAKNHRYVVTVSSPNQYPELIEEMKKNGGAVSEDKALEWAIKAFSRTALYDSQIANYLSKLSQKEEAEFPEYVNIFLTKKADLRYGENPHQKAAFYQDLSFDTSGFMNHLEQLGGKELSFNNLYDTQAAFALVREFQDPAVVIVKHNNPCGVASDPDLAAAARKALAGDPVSAFGGIVAFNRKVTPESVQVFEKLFLEVVIAPDFEPEALEILTSRKNLRILRAPLAESASFDIKKVDGGLLIQDVDAIDLEKEKIQIVTQKQPTEKEWEDLYFAWKVAKFVKSNAIVLAKNKQTVGIGAGQMSRIDALKIAVIKAQNQTQGSVLASDAFFPFKDVVEEAAKYGVTAIIQPGGSIRDQESIEACNRLGISMVFTGIRHFKH
ncbi:bifunctional phosphoribosylaminoimidazolecarboxamide formyltransferase/IMP cyclohydrolase [Thermatribacter velox]|uniref:Bifunctional purine biosynthesis protein PurH n=1 Tax=Thermatribacter velox TaxID=3039681 RepID=A0ABZ2Y930_9BACT